MTAGLISTIVGLQVVLPKSEGGAVRFSWVSFGPLGFAFSGLSLLCFCESKSWTGSDLCFRLLLPLLLLLRVYTGQDTFMRSTRLERNSALHDDDSGSATEVAPNLVQLSTKAMRNAGVAPAWRMAWRMAWT